MKTIFVLYSKKTGPTGRALAKKMLASCPNTHQIFFGTRDGLSSVVRRLGNRYPDYIINMGEFRADVEAVRRPAGTPVVLNHPASVAKSSNKRGSRIAFREAKVPAPTLWEGSWRDIPESGYPVVGRTTNHTQAHGFWLCKNPPQARGAANAGATHFLKFIPDTKEFRLHIIASTKKDGRKADDYVSIKMSEKIFSAATKKPGYDIIKNHDNGWVFLSPKTEYRKGLYRDMRNIAKQAVSLFDLDWGAVDIMYDQKNDKIYVLEINSSPCLTDQTANTIDKYSEWIMHLCEAKKKDISKYEASKAKTATRTPAVKQAVSRATVSSQQSNLDPDVSVLRNLFRRLGKG